MYTASWVKTVCLGLLFTGICALGTGCSGSSSSIAKVKGKVKFFDKYLTAGTVAFMTKDGRVGTGNIDFDGNYEVADAPVGECTIIVKVPTLQRVGKGMGPAKPPPGVPDMHDPSQESDKNFVPNTFDPTKIVQIPGKYGAIETSDLKYTVVKGDQTKDITLSP